MELVDGVFVHSSSYPGGNGDEGVGFPSIVLYSVDERIVFSMFVCEGLLWESVMAYVN